MTTYKIMAVTSEEYAKADLDNNYYPQEYVAGTITCEPWQIESNLHRAIKDGRFPKGSQYTE